MATPRKPAGKPAPAKRRGKKPEEEPDADPSREAPATFYLSDAKGPALSEAEVRADKKAWRASASPDREGRRGASGAIWNWDLFERAFVDGIIGASGERRWPTVGELADWSGASREVVKNRAVRGDWYKKRKIHEERLPGLVEDAVRRNVADKIGGYLASADEAVARKSARQWLRDVAEPYLDDLMKRIRGEGRHGKDGKPAPNVADGEKLLRLLLAVEGEATERIAVVGAVQVNLNLQRDATLSALDEAMARGIITEEQLPGILDLLQVHVSRVKWRYRVDGAELAEATATVVQAAIAEDPPG